MQRLRRLQQTIVQQRDQIARHNDYLLNEQRVAKAVFDRVAHSGCLDAPNARCAPGRCATRLEAPRPTCRAG